MNSLYHAAKSQLDNTQQQYYATKTQLQTTQQQYQAHANWLQDQLQSTQLELERERKASEVVNQQFLALEDSYLALQEEQKRTEQSERNALVFAKEVSKQVEGLHNGQSMGELILESVKNQELVHAMSGNYTEDDTVTKLKYFMEQNVEIQQRSNELYYQLKAKKTEIAEVENQLKAKNQQVENGKIEIAKVEKAMGELAKNRGDEIANLKKALELAGEDKQKRTRRAKPKQPLVD
jgi:hypothetical protein